MANLRGVKTKFKKFFSTKQASDEGIELLKKFILPFTQELPQRGIGIDDVLTAFFGLNDRVFIYARAKRDFKIPGGLYIAGNRAVHTHGQNTVVKKDQVVLLALDRKDNICRLEVVIEGKELNFKLERHEFETIKDWLKVIGDESISLGSGDDRPKPVARRNNRDRFLRRVSVSKRAGKLRRLRKK